MVALRLFVEQGYDETTVARIADAAGITPKAFFRHFATKADVVLGPHAEEVTALVRRIEEREPGETTLDALDAALRPRARPEETAEAELLCYRVLAQHAE